MPIAVISGTSRGARRRGAISYALDQHRQQTTGKRRSRHCHENQCNRTPNSDGRNSIPSFVDKAGRENSHHDLKSNHRTHHEDFAVGKVDELEDAVHQRISERDHGVDEASRHAADEHTRQLQGDELEIGDTRIAIRCNKRNADRQQRNNDRNDRNEDDDLPDRKGDEAVEPRAGNALVGG